MACARRRSSPEHERRQPHDAVQVCGDAQPCNTANEIKTTYTYWGNTLLPATVTQIDAARGETLVTTNTYDSAGRLKVSDGPMAGTDDATYFLYDQFGRQTWEIGPADTYGQATSQEDRRTATPTTGSWRSTGYVTSVTTPVLMALTRTETEYDSRRNPK